MEGTNKDFCPRPSIIKGSRAFPFVPCLSPRGQNDPYLSPLTCQSQKKGCGEAAMGAGFGVFVPCFRYRGQNGKQGTKWGQIVPRPYVSRVSGLFCLSPVTVFLRGQNGMKPWSERVYGFLSPVFDTGDKLPDRGQNGDKFVP